ncbi:unnamed protein product [Schistocephalus solidus]|uniref:Uncharacterized protein n=1 Tax=Schistocephalus solidus TaxID=70667 RepID=A0A183SQ18_SCHSO|nr:unnamed protein product [Schistocephalus solidus]
MPTFTLTTSTRSIEAEAVIPPEDEQKTSEKRPFDRPESRDRKSVPTVATNEGVGEAPNQLPATNQSTDERAQLLVRGLSAVAQIALGGDNSSGVIFPEEQRHFESARTNFQASDHTPSSVRQEEQHQSQKPLQQVRSSSLDTLRLEIDNAKQVSENAKTPTLICKAQSIRTDYSSSQEFSGPTSFSRFTQRTGCVTYDESMCFISCRKRRAAPQNDIFSIPKAQGIGGEGEGQTYMDNVHRLFYRPRVRSAESFPIPPGSDVSEQSINSKKKRQRTFSDLFKSFRRKQKPKKKEVEEKLGSTIGVLAAFSAGMLHSDAQAARKLDEGKTGRENPVEKEVYLKSTCLQPETKSSTPLHQTLFVITSPAAESSAKASQASSSSVRRKARTDSGILSNYSLSSSEVNEFCVSPTLSSRSVNSSSFSSPKINSSNCTTGKSTISYPTQGQNTTLEPVTRSEAIKLYPYLLSTNRLAPVRSLETISIPDNNIGDFTQNSGNQTQGPITVETGIQETHFPAFVGEINYADSDWIQAYMVNSEPPLFDEGVKIGFLPGDMTGASSCTPNEKLFDPAMIMPVRENQQFQTAAVFSPLETDREPEAPTDKNEQLDCRQASEQLPCHQGLENLQDSQAKEQKFPDAVEQKIPFIMNPNSHTSLTPDSDDEQTLDEISDRVLISDPVFFQGNETAKRNPEYLNSVNSMGGTGTVGVILKEDKRPLTYVKPLEILGNNGLPSLSPDAVFISPTRESQTLIKNGPNTDRTNAQLLGATGTRIIEPPEIPWPKSERTCHNWSKPENSAVRDVQAEEIHCSPVATSLESAICPQLPPNITKKSLTDKSPTSPTHSDAQSAEESMSMTSSDQPIALSRPASEYDLQKATLYFTEHQRQSQDIAGITNATFPRKTAGKLSAIPRPSPKILHLVEQAFESYERFPSPGLPYLEEQSRVDEKRCVLLYGSEDSTDFNENPLQQTGRELTKPSRWSFFSSLLPYILVDVVNLSDVDPRLLITVGVNQHSREHETGQGGSQYAALLHSVGHCECFGYRPIVSDARRHPVMKLTHHMREPLSTAEFLHDFSQSVVAKIMSRNGRVFEILRNFSLASHLLEECCGHIFEVLRNLSFVPHLLEDSCEFWHQSSPTVLVDFRWDRDGSRCFTAGNLLHGRMNFKLEHHLRDEEAVIRPTIGIADSLGHQHVLSISPPNENLVQQLSAPRPMVHPRGLLPRRKAEEGVGQQDKVFRTRLQKKEAVIVTATETVGIPALPARQRDNPDKSLEMLLRFTQNFLFNNPFGIAGMFLCITLAAPRLQQVPFLLANCLSPQALTEAVTAVTRQPGAFFSERFCDLVAVFRVTPSWSAFAITGGRGLHWHLARPTI